MNIFAHGMKTQQRYQNESSHVLVQTVLVENFNQQGTHI